MHARHAQSIARLTRVVLDGRGVTDRALRAAVQERVTSSGTPPISPNQGVLVPAVAAYVDKVSRHAYRVSDDDVAALKTAGFSEDAIFEITVAAAVAAGLDRLERGLRLLQEGRP